MGNTSKLLYKAVFVLKMPGQIIFNSFVDPLLHVLLAVYQIVRPLFSLGWQRLQRVFRALYMFMPPWQFHDTHTLVDCNWLLSCVFSALSSASDISNSLFCRHHSPCSLCILLTLLIRSTFSASSLLWQTQKQNGSAELRLKNFLSFCT